MSSPRVSVIMGTYNRAGLIRAAVRSVQMQDFTDWELIISDDGSMDNTPEVGLMLEKEDPRIRYIRNEVNQGISKNYNVALRAARGEYVAMIDDDDPWIPKDKLTRQVAFLDSHPDYVGCGAGVIVVDAEGKEKYRYLKPQTDEQIRSKMLFSNPMANSTTLFRRNFGEKVGWYDEHTRYSGDRDFWLKLGKLGKLYNEPDYFSYYTMTGHNTSIARIKPHLKSSLEIMRRYKGDYPNYYRALFLNYLQLAYAYLPESFRRVVHERMARLKRKVFG